MSQSGNPDPFDHLAILGICRKHIGAKHWSIEYRSMILPFCPVNNERKHCWLLLLFVSRYTGNSASQLAMARNHDGATFVMNVDDNLKLNGIADL